MTYDGDRIAKQAEKIREMQLTIDALTAEVRKLRARETKRDAARRARYLAAKKGVAL